MRVCSLTPLRQLPRLPCSSQDLLLPTPVLLLILLLRPDLLCHNLLLSRVRTRLQKGITQPKVFKDGTVRYNTKGGTVRFGMLASTG